MKDLLAEDQIREALSKERLVLFGVVTTFLSLLPTAYAALISNSTTLLADLLRCASEFLAIFASWLILRKVAAGDTARFNYGFGKLEQLASVAVASALFLTFLIALTIGLRRLFLPEPVENVTFGLILALLSVGGNAFLWILNYLSYKSSRSPISDSQWRLFRAKTMATVVVLASLSGTMFFPQANWSLYVDGVGSILLSLFMLWSAYSLMLLSVPDLIDCAVEEALEKTIQDLLAQFSADYIALERMRSRRVLKRIYVELFISFDPQRDFGDVHETVMKLKQTVREKLPGAEVLVIPSVPV
jgi:ferrous-iron efflux pump FieF